MENLLLKISLAISLFGVLFLLILANFSQPVIQGKIISIKTHDDFKIILLDNNRTITCNSCQLKINQTIQVQGKITEYQSPPQISADKIQVLKNAN